MVTPLKLALLNNEKPMYQVALKVGISESRLSRLTTGLFKPKEKEKEVLSKALGIPVFELFPEHLQAEGAKDDT